MKKDQVYIGGTSTYSFSQEEKLCIPEYAENKLLNTKRIDTLV